jgi:DNA-binding response OmpR family regulator
VHILIVEDEPSQRSRLERWLREHGHTTTSTWTVAGAEKALAKDDFDAVLLDIGLEGDAEAGLEIPPMVRRGIPIFAITGADEQVMRAKAVINRLDGVIRWYQKPLRAQDLHKLLDDLATKGTGP